MFYPAFRGKLVIILIKRIILRDDVGWEYYQWLSKLKGLRRFWFLRRKWLQLKVIEKIVSRTVTYIITKKKPHPQKKERVSLAKQINLQKFNIKKYKTIEQLR